MSDFLSCANCSDLKSDHFEGRGECLAVHAMIGPSDNTDVWEELCDCEEYMPWSSDSDWEGYNDEW